MTIKGKLKRVPEGVLLPMDETLWRQLGWTDGMEVEVSVSGESYVITPVRERDEKFRESAEKIVKQYGDVFRRLADS